MTTVAQLKPRAKAATKLQDAYATLTTLQAELLARLPITSAEISLLPTGQLLTIMYVDGTPQEAAGLQDEIVFKLSADMIPGYTFIQIAKAFESGARGRRKVVATLDVRNG